MFMSVKNLLENDHNIVVFVKVFSYLGVTSATIKALVNAIDIVTKKKN